MKCKFCGSANTKVIDSRDVDEENVIRRRRECETCGRRFTTYEKFEETPIYVIKKSGGRQAFDENKIRRGVVIACEKRQIPSATINALVSGIKSTIFNSGVTEIKSDAIGNMVMEALEKVDDVAYIRFASVYRQFNSMAQFAELLQGIVKNRENG